MIVVDIEQLIVDMVVVLIFVVVSMLVVCVEVLIVDVVVVLVIVVVSVCDITLRF